jgi:uncharacterized lipoprotein NlpE involved in copper resistance
MKKCIISFFAAITLLAACDPENDEAGRFAQRCDVEVVVHPTDSVATRVLDTTYTKGDTVYVNFKDCIYKYMNDDTHEVNLDYEGLKIRYKISGSTAYGGSYGLVYTMGDLEGSGYYDLLGTRTTQITDTLNNIKITIKKK